MLYWVPHAKCILFFKNFLVFTFHFVCLLYFVFVSVEFIKPSDDFFLLGHHLSGRDRFNEHFLMS